MHILTRKREFLQAIRAHVPLKQSRLFAFGYDTLVGTDVVSTRANARRSPLKWPTAKGKMWRLLGNARVAACFPQMLAALALVSPEDVIAVDFSDFRDGRQILMFAKQTKTGRALPVYFEMLEYPIAKDSQNAFVIAAVGRFVEAAGSRPRLVFDRGFAAPAIVKYLAQNKHRFIIRIKKRKRVTLAEGTHAAEDAGVLDAIVAAYGHDLRLVVSDQPGNGNDPWYLITNDTAASRGEIVDWYYHRFEIEEFFRDAKRLLRLEWVRCKTAQSLTIILWFALLTAWLFASIAAALTPAEHRERMYWRVSLFRYVFEKLEQELRFGERPPQGAVGGV